jgi:hypothetical protein
MEERAIEEKQIGEARDKVRAQLHRAEKVAADAVRGGHQRHPAAHARPVTAGQSRLTRSPGQEWTQERRRAGHGYRGHGVCPAPCHRGQAQGRHLRRHEEGRQRRRAGPEAHSGEDAGEHLGEGVGSGVERAARARWPASATRSATPWAPRWATRWAGRCATGGAGIGAVASTAVTALAALGPAFAGAGAAGIAAFGSVKLAVGLVGLALKTQTPALERFTKSTQAIKDAIGGQVQLGLFATLTPAIQTVNGIVPQLSGNLNRMGASVGTVGAQFARMLATTNGVRTLNSILNVSIGFIDAAGPGLVAMGQALMIVFAHLGPIARSVGTLVTEAGRAALAFIQAKDATGELDSFLARVSNAAEVLGGALISFGIGIINVFRAASGASGGMITNLAKLATRFQLWTGNPANQAKMVDFFVRMRQITGMLIGVFGQLAGATARGLNSTSVSKFKGVLDTLVSVGTSLGGVFEQIRANAGDKLQVMFTRLADVIGQLAALVVAALVWFFTQTEIGRAIIEAVWNAIKVAIGAVVDALVAAWNWMVDAFKVGRGLGGPIMAQTIWHAIEHRLQCGGRCRVNRFHSGLERDHHGLERDLGLHPADHPGHLGLHQAVFNEIVTVIEWYLNLLWQIWIRVWPILALPIRILYGVIILIFQAIWDFISFIVGKRSWTSSSGPGTAWSAGSRLPFRRSGTSSNTSGTPIWGFIQPIIQAIVDFCRGPLEQPGQQHHAAGAGLDLGNHRLMSGTRSGASSADYRRHCRLHSTDRWNNLVGQRPDRPELGEGHHLGRLERHHRLHQRRDGQDRRPGQQGLGLRDRGRGGPDGIKAAVNVVIDAINWVIGGINWAIDLANKLPGPDIPNIPTIPRLARGGVVSPTGGGTLAMIAEAGRPERVEPLDPSGLSARDRALIDRLAPRVAAVRNVSVYIGTRELTELVDCRGRGPRGPPGVTAC